MSPQSIPGPRGVRARARCSSVATLVIALVLSVAQPLLATDYIMLEIASSPVGARSLVLWPPNSPDPGSLALYFGSAGPITMPFSVMMNETDPWCESFLPVPDFMTEYLTGWSDHGNAVFADPAGFLAAPSNEQGYAMVMLPLQGGGSAEGPHAFYLGGPGIFCSFTFDDQLRVNSPDINGDLVVNLSDVPLFAADYFGVYNYRSDFFWDGQINLGDLVYLARAMGTYK